ncbi:hypothetical protein FB451DRAFT_1219696 [Mycena latifolia]|nr:hypothetical protein FB451DRAFT_1219696 [Mycena latifolia]
MARFVTVLGLLAFICSSALCEHLRPRHNQLKPFKSLNLIPGLLNRASCSGCPIGAVCCSNGDGCCATAHRCCSDGGCCQLSEYCVTVDGVKGCCPVGAICTGAPTTTSDHEITTKTGTTKTGTSTTLIGAPTSTTSTTSTGATSTQSALNSVPTPTTGSQNVVVDMSDITLAFSGQWESTTSSCNSSTHSQTVSSDGSEAEYSTVSYSFKGSAIYIKTASINAHYAIVLDADVTEYGGSSFGQIDVPPNCTYGWYRDGLDSDYHSILISVFGGNSTLVSGRRATEAWAFELHNFVITKTSSATSSNAPASTGSTSPSGGGASTTASLSSAALCLVSGFWAALILL